MITDGGQDPLELVPCNEGKVSKRVDVAVQTSTADHNMTTSQSSRSEKITHTPSKRFTPA